MVLGVHGWDLDSYYGLYVASSQTSGTSIQYASDSFGPWLAHFEQCRWRLGDQLCLHRHCSVHFVEPRLVQMPQMGR